MWLFPLFLAIPLIEIALFVTIGGWLTLWPTLAIVVLTGATGAILIRRQGLRTLDKLRRSVERMDDPLQPLAHGAVIVLAGVLLLTPGFLTDTLGLLLLVPAVRTALLRHLAGRVKVRAAAWGQARPAHAEVIEGEYEVYDPGPRDAPPLPPRSRH